MSCGDDGCTTDHGPLVFTGRCHPKSPTILEYSFRGVVSLICKACNAHSVNIEISHAEQMRLDPKLGQAGDLKLPEGKETILRLRAPCHPKRGLFVIYNDGVLNIVCGKCKKPVDDMAVAVTATVAAAVAPEAP